MQDVKIFSLALAGTYVQGLEGYNDVSDQALALFLSGIVCYKF